jgi:hypothetical protein
MGKFPCHKLIWPDANACLPWHGEFDERFGPLLPNLTTGNWAGTVPKS